MLLVSRAKLAERPSIALGDVLPSTARAGVGLNRSTVDDCVLHVDPPSRMLWFWRVTTAFAGLSNIARRGWSDHDSAYPDGGARQTRPHTPNGGGTMSRTRPALLAAAAIMAVIATPAQARVTASRAAQAVDRKVERRYSEGRTVLATCHRRNHGRSFFCEYGIMGGLEDGIRAGEEGRETAGYVAEGDAKVIVEGSRLTVRLLGPPSWK